jgi:hypothetical protein
VDGLRWIAKLFAIERQSFLDGDTTTQTTSVTACAAADAPQVGGRAPPSSMSDVPRLDQGRRCRQRRRGSSCTDGPDNRCYGSIYGGDYCAGTCDENNHCTCREVGDCDGYGSGSGSGS